MSRNNMRLVCASAVLCVGLALAPGSAWPVAVRPVHVEPIKEPAAASLDELAMRFEPNVGQTDTKVRYVARGDGYAVYLTDAEAVLSLGSRDTARPGKTESESRRDALKLRWTGGRAEARPRATDELASKSNYFTGTDQSKWRSDVPNFGRIRYDGIYDGIDAVFYGNQGRLEYDFEVAPGADATQIRLQFEGAKSVSLDSNGDLELRMSGGVLRQLRALAYQEHAEGKREVEARYELGPDGGVRFDLGDHDPARPLVIDPVLEYSVYLGGTAAYDDAEFVAVDSTGAAYVTGTTRATNLPATAGAFDTSVNGDFDVFVAKLAPSGASLVYATYLGSDAFDVGQGIAVDASGAAYVTGNSVDGVVDFPTTPGAFDTTHNGRGDAFVAKLSPSGASLVYSTFLGGDLNDNGFGIAVDS